MNSLYRNNKSCFRNCSFTEKNVLAMCWGVGLGWAEGKWRINRCGIEGKVDGIAGRFVYLISSYLSPLTLEVVGAPQMMLQQYLSILPCLPLPSGISKPHSRLFLDVTFPSLLLSSSPSLSFHCPLQNGLRHAKRT